MPLEIFFHNQLALQKKLEELKAAQEPDEDLIADLALTVDFARNDFAVTTANLEHLLAAKEITFDLLWAIFPPNSLVYRYHELIEQDQILQLRTIEMAKVRGRRIWELSCTIIADDGVKFGIASEPFWMTIFDFSGSRSLTDLPIYPLKYHSRADEVRRAVLSRGARFAQLSQPRVMETSGPSMFEKRDPQYEAVPYKFTSQGRMIVDPATFRSFNGDVDFLPRVYKELSRQDLTDEELLICTPVVFGFCFANKKWGMLPSPCRC